METILAALITGAVTLIGVLIANSRSQAANLLIIREPQVQRHPQRRGKKRLQRRQHAGDKPFHIRAAATVVAPVAFGKGERRHRPRLTIHRHHVCMAGEHHPAGAGWPKAGIEVCLAPFVVIKQLRLHAARAQKVADPGNQRQIRLAAGGIKRQQRAEDLTHAVIHRPAPRRSALRAGQARG